MSQSQKIFTFGVSKITNGYLGICSDIPLSKPVTNDA